MVTWQTAAGHEGVVIDRARLPGLTIPGQSQLLGIKQGQFCGSHMNWSRLDFVHIIVFNDILGDIVVIVGPVQGCHILIITKVDSGSIIRHLMDRRVSQADNRRRSAIVKSEKIIRRRATTDRVSYLLLIGGL